MLARPEPTVFIVDDDQGARESLRWLVSSVGLQVETFSSARQFLEAYDPERPGCLVLDVRMPGLSGLDLQERLLAHGKHPPIILLTGHGDVAMAVRAMKAGAFDFLEKPCSSQVLLDSIHHALEHDDARRTDAERHRDIARRASLLTAREREVMNRVTAGMPNKAIAAELGLSAKTVEAHRAKVMEKMQAGSLSDLVRMALLLDKQG